MALVIEAFLEVLEATLPTLALIMFFQLVVLRRVPPKLRTMLVGVGMATFGFFLFILGAKISLIPIGMRIGDVLARVQVGYVLGFMFILGIAIMFAEPAVGILAYEIAEVSAGALRKRWVVGAIALGSGVALALSTLRIIGDWSLLILILPLYLITLFLTLKTPRKYVAIAYDAGAVATGPVVVNFALPLTTGLAIGLWGDAGVGLGFGVVGIIAICPILFMLLLGNLVAGRRSS